MPAVEDEEAHAVWSAIRFAPIHAVLSQVFRSSVRQCIAASAESCTETACTTLEQGDIALAGITNHLLLLEHVMAAERSDEC